MSERVGEGKKIHFVGIGGIGMSALARYYRSLGASITGSDANESDLINDLRHEGMIITIGEDESAVPDDLDTLIYTIAIKSDNHELVKGLHLATEKGVKVMTYPQALGEISKDKKVIAVCGTHGKTTTTALVYKALTNAGLDVSMIVGSLINHEGKRTNYIHGSSDWIVIEACEYRRSFLQYYPEIILITNIDADHLDYYKDIDEIHQAFKEFVEHLPAGRGKLIVHSAEMEKFTVNQNYTLINADAVDSDSIVLSVPGAHNRRNAQLVVALGQALQLDDGKVREGLQHFKGTWRRQEDRGLHFGMQCYDDYAHHPQEIRATLQAFREKYPDKKIIAIFMPHLYSRTKLLFDDFADSFGDADEILLLPIYAARETYDATISSDLLAIELDNKGKKATAFADMGVVRDYLEIHSHPDTIVVTMGAGDIHKIYK